MPDGTTESPDVDSMGEDTTGEGALPPVKATECRNCGQRFVGNYCPNCGQEAVPPDSVLGVLSVFFRELVDVEGGLWTSIRALTARPGVALSRYLGGARQDLMHPGRYLLASIVVAFGTDRVFTWIGMRTPYDERVSGSVTEPESSKADPATDELQSLLTWAAERVLESQVFLIAGYLLLTGFLSLTIWRLFRSHFQRGAQAVAFSALVVGHTVFLSTVAELLYFPADYLRAGPTSGLPANALVVITAVYVTLVTTRTFGGGWKSSAKGLLAIGWAGLEQVVVQGIVIGGYFAWIIYTRLGDELSAEGAFKLSGDTTAMAVPILPAVAILLIPFALHAGLEFYYRRQ
ncbi:hypothetical protein GGP80_002093 [Salinibacter ruber]|uniref:DUF3667 domain-containing protein n=1 Tax=Salinibacter ruber TaxID=146919 RepID=UPI001615396C|nr:DUF3667 domain-containing protein [Salinibacter ruber]MBB4060261.1 hypothetical protein [Salinibacter ruber]MCS3936104.1 hypothetical protein [Salinibacter ruber]MCS4043409.1 hypothetical protein [Salinibacter ruber]